MVYVVKTTAVEELRKKIENGKKLSKESVINENQVTIEPDGKWSTNTRTPSPSKGNQDFDIEGDDDIIEIKDSKFLSIRNHSTPGTSTSTPPTSLYSREPSTAMSAPRPSNKRPASSVIDLTLSDEDEEPISRAPKRQSTATFGTTQVPHYATPGRS
ncbi:E3 SUMO-protein ligase pli1 [Pseudogymnoascus australis]